MLGSEVIDEQDLEELANARAEVISTAFLASGEFDQNRVIIAASKKVESGDSEWGNLECVKDLRVNTRTELGVAWPE